MIYTQPTDPQPPKKERRINLRTVGPSSPKWQVLGASGIFGLVGLGLFAGIQFKALSPVILLDLVALWPLLLLPAAMMVWSIWKRTSRAWTRAILCLISVTLLAFGAHFSGWRALPSAAARVTGVAISEFVQVDLSVSIPEGRLVVGPGTSAATYRAIPMHNGGPVGAVRALERIEGTNLEVVLGERTDSGWYQFGGWRVVLSKVPVWKLDLVADTLDLDLSALAVGELAVAGTGELKLPLGTHSVAEVSGTWLVEVPPDASVEVIGDALVPFDWKLTDFGTRSPWAGPGWTINVTEGSSVTVIEADVGS